MAFKPGYKGDFRLDTGGGALTNLQPYIDTVSVSMGNETHDVSALGTVSKAFIAGLSSAQISVGGAYDTAANTHFSGVQAAQDAGTASFSFQWGPGGSVSGEAKITGEAVLTGYTASTSVNGRVEWTGSLQVTGAVTNSTF